MNRSIPVEVLIDGDDQTCLEAVTNDIYAFVAIGFAAPEPISEITIQTKISRWNCIILSMNSSRFTVLWFMNYALKSRIGM